ncbi:MAG: hypothetical protein L0Z73_14565 [Gammaproteobacteria bacterium]|nr:hypothetical protein [Gammaproteobacteria bacterium]
MDNVLKTMVGRARMGLSIERGDLKRSLGLSSKSIVYQLKEYPAPVDSIPGFEKNHRQVIKYSKILKRAGYVGLALDGVQSAATIRKACTIGTEEECTRSKFSEGGRFSGSIGGGALGGWAGYGLCNLVFGIESAGTSLLWCGIVAAGAGGYFGGKYEGEYAQGKGELLYKTYNK